MKERDFPDMYITLPPLSLSVWYILSLTVSFFPLSRFDIFISIYTFLSLPPPLGFDLLFFEISDLLTFPYPSLFSFFIFNSLSPLIILIFISYFL